LVFFSTVIEYQSYCTVYWFAMQMSMVIVPFWGKYPYFRRQNRRLSERIPIVWFRHLWYTWEAMTEKEKHPDDPDNAVGA
jgi:hypothetical protein